MESDQSVIVQALTTHVRVLAREVRMIARREAVGRGVVRSLITIIERGQITGDALVDELRKADAVLDKLDMEACTS